ncbi:MAG: DUF1559 domain-containing protein [Pirellula sp.]
MRQDMIKRFAFSLAELLVVLAIVSAVLALLLPAIHSARESARVMSCQNQSKQIALAILSFESAHRMLPSNGWGYRWIYDPKRGVGVSQPGGWIGQVAPYAEFTFPNAGQGALAEFDMRTQLNASNWQLMHCPSRSSGLSLSSTSASPINAAYMAMVGKTDYAANEGDFITDTRGGPLSLVEGDNARYDWTSTEKATGVIFLRSTIRQSDITDGTSQTYLTGEKYVSRNHYFDGRDLGYDQSMFSGVDLDLNRWTIEPPKRDANSANVRLFGAPHASGCNLSLCDGSVHQISYDIDATIHRSFGNRRDRR